MLLNHSKFKMLKNITHLICRVVLMTHIFIIKTEICDFKIEILTKKKTNLD